MQRRKFLISLLVICLVIVYFYLITDYMKQDRLRDVLAGQINDTARTLGLIPKPAPDLEIRLAESRQANLTAKEGMAVSGVNTTQIIDSILKEADNRNLKITTITTEAWAEKKIEADTYRILRIGLGIEGSFSDMVTFLERLEDSRSFPSLALETVTLGQTSQTNNKDISHQVQADIEIVVFTLSEAGNQGD